MDNDNATRVTTTVVDGIPGYRISRLLDQGGMGGVYLAEDETLRRLVAIKVINPDLTENTEFKQRFTTEALIIAGFQHANIVTIFASGWLGPKQYFVMEYVSGGTLKQRLDSGRLPPHDAYRIAQQMADALGYSHQREVIHRDFKPNNVLLRENGTPVLSDFGIAKSVVIDGAKTAIGVVVGSALYMAPEQALGAEISNRVDIYSFGLVLYQMLAGELPSRHPIRSRDDARHLARSLRTVDPACVDLIARCLRAAPMERPTAVECRDVLASLTRRALPQHTSRRVPLLAAVGVLIAVIAVASAWRLGYFDAHPAPPTHEQPASPAESPATAPAPALIPVPAASVTPTAVIAAAPPVGPPAAVAPDAAAANVHDKPSPPKTKSNAVVAKSQPAVATTPMKIPAGMVPLTVQVTPPTARLLLDGEAMTSASMPVQPGMHNVAALASGYYGHIDRVSLADPKSNAVTLSLEPTTLPSSDELMRFLKLSRNQALTPVLVQDVSERTLRESLRIQRLHQSNHIMEAEGLTKSVNALRHFGDFRAAVAAFLVEAMNSAKIDRSLVTPALTAASDGGDALASFFLALAHRESFDSDASHLAGSGLPFQNFCRRMGMAATQGLADAAGQFRRLEHCTQ
jgi:hypothetical protein